MSCENYIIKSENTAIVKGVCSSIKKYIEKFDKTTTILDYGCGKLRNSLYLLNLGYDVAILDTEEQINKIKCDNFKKIFTQDAFSNNTIEKFDLILNSFVLNVISDIEIRNNIVKNIYNSLNENGFAIFEVRRESEVKSIKYKQEYNDGWIVGKNNVKTFQKFYNKNELEDILIFNRFKIINSNSTGNSYYCLTQKENI